MRFNNLYNASPMGSSRRYDSETGRGHRTSENTDSPESSPPQSPESSDVLQGLSHLQINRPRSNTQPNTQRRGLASRISSLFGGGNRPAPRPVLQQEVETALRIDRARGPEPAPMSANDVRAAMMGVLAGLQNGEALITVWRPLPFEVARHFAVRPASLTSEGRALVASYGPTVLEAFESALSLLSASRRPDISAGQLRRRGTDAGTTSRRSARSGNSDAAAQPRARTGNDNAARPRPTTSGNRAASTSADPVQTLIDGGFVRASNAFLRPEASMADVAAAAQISERALSTFLTEQGVTREGLELLHRCDLSTQAAVLWNVGQGTTRRAEANSNAAQPASPEQPASPIQPESPRLFGLPSAQWSGAAMNPATPGHEVTGPQGYPWPTHPSTPSWEVAGSAGPAMSADSSLLGSHFSQWPGHRGAPGQEVMGPPGRPLPADPSTPSWEVAGSAGPSMSADSSLLGSHFSHWPGHAGTPGQEVMGPPGHPLPAYPNTPSWEVAGSAGPAMPADSSLLGSHFSHWPDHPGTPGQEVMGPPGSPLPADSNTTFGNLSSFGTFGYHDAPAFDLNENAQEVVGPEAQVRPTPSDTTFRSLGSLGPSTIGGELRDDAHSSTWDFHTPTAMPYGSSDEYGYHDYAAGSSSQPQQAVPAPAHDLVLSNLPVGPLQGMTRQSFLEHVNAEMGYASSQGLNCLLDSLLQRFYDTRRWLNHEPPHLARNVLTLRRRLVMLGQAAPHGNIDAEGANLLAVTLAANYAVRIQFIEERADRSLTVHPVYGDQGPLIHILHTPGHFQPLWPKN